MHNTKENRNCECQETTLSPISPCDEATSFQSIVLPYSMENDFVIFQGITSCASHNMIRGTSVLYIS